MAVRSSVGTLLLLACVALWLHQTVRPLWNHGGFDLAALLVGAQVVADGHADELYAHDAGVFNQVSAQTQHKAAISIGYPGKLTPFIQAPLVAHIARPLAQLGFATARRLWLVASALAVLLSLLLLERLYVPPDLRGMPLRAVAVLALIPFAPVTYGLLLGQTTPIVLFVLLAALLAQRHGRPVLAGLLLAPVALLKITPIVFALLWLWRGPRRAALACFAALVLLLALSLLLDGPELHARWLHFVGEIDAQMLVAHNNHSLKAFLGRTVTPLATALGWQLLPTPQWIWAAQMLLTFVVPLALLRVFQRIPDELAWRPLAEALAGVWLVLAPSLAWTHYLVFLLPAFAVLAVRFHRKKAREALVALGLAFVLCCQPFVVDPAERELYASISLSGPGLCALLLLAFLVLAAREAAAMAESAADSGH